jgi:nucleoside-diphosphate-sugar epimerase
VRAYSVFVTGATGFIGRELVRRLASAGYDVLALTRRTDKADALRELGVTCVVGDLLRPSGWSGRAESADLVVHLAQPLAFGGRVTRSRAETYRDERLEMDANLLAAARSARRIIYVAGTSYYGDTGQGRADEAVAPRPRGWGPYIAPAIEQATHEAGRGLPLVMAFPGYVYGDGSWFREYVLRPLRSRARLHVVAGRSRVASPVHIVDCARALIHLLEHGEVGARYFVVDDEPQPWSTFYGRAAEAVGVPLRVRALSPRLLRLLVGPVVTDSLVCDTALSNERLRRLGFELEHPTTATGVPDVVRGARPTSALPSMSTILWAQAREMLLARRRPKGRA